MTRSPVYFLDIHDRLPLSSRHRRSALGFRHRMTRRLPKALRRANAVTETPLIRNCPKEAVDIIDQEKTMVDVGPSQADLLLASPVHGRGPGCGPLFRRTGRSPFWSGFAPARSLRSERPGAANARWKKVTGKPGCDRNKPGPRLPVGRAVRPCSARKPTFTPCVNPQSVLIRVSQMQQLPFRPCKNASSHSSAHFYAATGNP